MLAKVKRFWRGELPLATAFWLYAVTYGLALNVVSTILALIAYVQFDNVPLAVFLHISPWPYLVIAFIGAWRSAERYDGAQLYALLTKVSLIVLVAGSILL